jgi:hypothetical protein
LFADLSGAGLVAATGGIGVGTGCEGEELAAASVCGCARVIASGQAFGAAGGTTLETCGEDASVCAGATAGVGLAATTSCFGVDTWFGTGADGVPTTLMGLLSDAAVACVAESDPCDGAKARSSAKTLKPPTTPPAITAPVTIGRTLTARMNQLKSGYPPGIKMFRLVGPCASRQRLPIARRSGSHFFSSAAQQVIEASLFRAAMRAAKASPAPGTLCNFKRLLFDISSLRRFSKMDAHDRELLDRQLQQVKQPSEESSLVAAIIVVFFVGVTFGGLVFSASEPMRVASVDTPPLVAQAYNAAPFSRE